MALEDNTAPDQVADETQSVGGEQPVAGQAAGEESNEQSTVSGSEIVVGNQKFASIDELRKAYESAQRGLTQSSQKYAKQLKAYEGVSSWLKGLMSDKAKWERFKKFYETDGVEEKEEQTDPRYDDLRSRLEAQEIQQEVDRFNAAHQDLDEETKTKIVDVIREAEDRGERWSLEMAYRWVSHEKNSAKLVSEGQRKVEDSIKKGKGVKTLGASPTAAQAKAPSKTPFSKLKGATAKNAHIESMLDEMYPEAKFD